MVPVCTGLLEEEDRVSTSVDTRIPNTEYFYQKLPKPTGDHFAWMLRLTSQLWVRILAEACEKVASDLGLGNGFAGISGFLHQIQLASHDLAAI